ncbi:hypothetical protein ZWY2020_025191 [Hordeum vulgare]|nr:hypothetical protein ZWY2020_025191 [Hordeum vulgare]
MAPCPGGAGVHARWTARALAGAFLDLAIVYAFLCAAAAASAASALLALLRLRLPCTCSRPHLPCLFAFRFRYPSRVLRSLLLSLRSRFPFVVNHDDDSRDEEESVDEDEEEEEVNLKREADEGNDVLSALHQELDKERSAAASAAEEAMAMILRLQKEKSSVEMEVRQQRRTSDERCAFYENEVEELKDILLMRERENRSLQKEVESYRRLLGIAGDDEEEEMMTPRNYLESDPSSSRSVDNNNSVFSFKKQFVRQQVSPIRVGHVKDRNENSPAFQPLGQVPVAGSKLGADSCQDDGTETVSARCLDQGGGVEVNAAADMKAMEELTADEFQEVDSGRLDKACHDFMASDNDANIFDVHVVDDICFSTEVKGLIGRSFSDATMQADKLQNRAA